MNRTRQPNGQGTARQGGYFHAEVMVNNASAPQYPALATTAVFQGASKTETGNAFVAQTPESYLYDGDGNLKQDGRWIYSWDSDNRLIGMETRSDVPTAARRKLAFAYDAQGRRIRKQVFNWNAGSWILNSEFRYIYSGWNLLAELDGNNAVVRSYVWGLDVSGTLQGAGGVELEEVAAGRGSFLASTAPVHRLHPQPRHSICTTKLSFLGTTKYSGLTPLGIGCFNGHK